MQKILTDYFRPLLVIYFSLDLTLKGKHIGGVYFTE